MSPVTEGEIDQLVERIGLDACRIEEVLNVTVHRKTRGELERGAAEVVAEAAATLGDTDERPRVGNDAPGGQAGHYRETEVIGKRGLVKAESPLAKESRPEHLAPWFAVEISAAEPAPGPVIGRKVFGTGKMPRGISQVVGICAGYIEEYYVGIVFLVGIQQGESTGGEEIVAVEEQRPAARGAGEPGVAGIAGAACLLGE